MNKLLRYIPCLFLLLTFGELVAQSLLGTVTSEDGKPVAEALIFVKETAQQTTTNKKGKFQIDNISKGDHVISVFAEGFRAMEQRVVMSGRNKTINLTLQYFTQELQAVQVEDEEILNLGESWMLSVIGTGIYEGKKSELITVDQIIGNKAANVSRQIYAQVPGLNIWENDGAGIQLGIGGRGLNPNRTSNFNVRQNGYDIAADALGYPESYYTPPIQAIERIEIVRGAAGLQYGTQFGGMVNFKFKKGPTDKPIDLNIKQTIGSFGLFNSFNSVGGQVGKLNYYGFYQYKTSNGWRPNAGIEQHNAFASLTYSFTPFISWKLEHTHSQYLAQQPGGLTDNEFQQDPRQSKRTRNWFDVNWDLTASVFDVRLSPNFKINNRTFFLAAHRFAVGNLGRIDRPDDLTADRNLLKDEYANWGNELRAIWNYRLFGQEAVLLVGNRYYSGETSQGQGMANNSAEADFNFLNREEPADSKFTFPSQNLSFFAENIFNISKKLSFTPGVRYEYILTEAEGYFFDRRTDLAGNIIFEEQVPEDKGRTRNFAILGIGASYKENSLLEAYTNFSQNFRAINFNDIRVNNPSLVVDENIEDEKGFNADFGVRGAKPEFFRYDVSLFYLSYNQRIGTILRAEPDPRFGGLINRTIRFRTNIADANIFGFEAYGEADVLKLSQTTFTNMSLQYFVNVAMITSRYRNSESNGVEGNEVELVPPINFKTGFTYRIQDFGLSFLYSHVAEHFSDASNTGNIVPTAVEGLIPSYDVFDLSLSYSWKWMNLESGVNNLLDSRYFTRRAAGYPGPGIIPSDGRSFYVTVGVNF